MNTKQSIYIFFILTFLVVAIFIQKQSFQVANTPMEYKTLIFLGENAYEEPVWEELLAQEVIHFQDVDAAFHAYYDDENHELSHQQHEAWEKWERQAKSQLDGAGNLYSKSKQYRDLLKYRQAKRNLNAPTAQFSFNTPTTYTMGIPNAGNAGRWKNIGPFGNPEVHWSATGNGALDMVVFHPTNPAIIYAAARNRGLYRSENYGNNWIPLTDHFATPHIRSIAVNQGNPNVLYLGGIDKIWRSADAANSWTEVFNVSSADVIQEIHTDPNNANRAIAMTEGGVYRTTDGGQNWTEVFDGRFVHLDISEDWSLMITADDNSDVLPTLSYSLDKGDTWKTSTITNEFAEVDKFYFAITETNPKQVYAYGLLDDNEPTRFIGLWKATFDPIPADGTSHFPNWTKATHSTYPYPIGHTQLVVEPDSTHGVKSETSDYYGSINPYSSARWISDFWVSPNNPNRLLTLREKMWGSEDGGISWSFKPSYGGSNWADNRYVTMNTAKDTIFWCNDGGVWSIAEADMFPTEAMVTASGLSTSAYMASKVVPKNGDICVIEGSEMDVSQMNKDVVMTGGQDIGQIFTRNGRDAHVASADVYRGRMKPNNDSLFHTGGLDVTVDGGTDIYEVYNSINADYHNPDRMYGFTRRNLTSDTRKTLLVRSPAGVDGWLINGFRGEGQANAGGHGWTPVNSAWETFTTSAGISEFNKGTFEQSRANAEIAFLGDEEDGRLFITNNLSATQPTWTQLPNAPSATRYRIATHQFNENIVVAATDGGVYISKDKGQTWATRGNLPEGSPSRVLLDKNRTEGIYVMTSMTVYYTDETLTEWVEFNQGQPLHQNQDMRIAYYANGDNRLYVAKYGSGVWGTPLYSVLADNNDMPVVDFRIHGNSQNVINSGEEVQLIDLSMNYTTLAWTVENGGEVHQAGNEKYPTFTLTTTGFYKVTLTATNANGSISEVKERYFEVIDQPDLVCVPESEGEMSWTRRIRYIDMNGERYTNDSYDYYVPTNHIFEISTNQSSLFLEQRVNYRKKHQRAWIDYNNDGDFDNTTEEIANSGGLVYNSTANFTPPNNAVLNTPLRMRIVVINEETAPSDCENAGDRQTIDFFVKIKTPAPTITNSHTVQTVNSTTIASTYSNAMNVVESGILYSTFNGNLNFNNASKVAKSGALTAAENFNTALTDLEFNVTYYYQTYVVNGSGVHYGEKKNFTLAPYKMPTAESFYAINLGGTEWELKGFVFPEGNQLMSITMEHGENNFSNSTTIDISDLDINNIFNISEIVDLSNAASYQFRIKVEDNGQTFYSNIYTFQTNQTMCSPSISNYVWYKRFIGITLGDFVHDNSDAEAYEDLTATKLGNFEMGQSYTMTMKIRTSSWTNLSYIAYIDFNADNDFDDYNEIVGTAAANGNQYNDLTFTIPTQDVITNRKLTMRIVGHEGGTVTSCNSNIGSYKDISVLIKPSDCTGTGHYINYYADNDDDGFGDPNNAVFRNCQVTSLAGYKRNKKDCDDTNPDVHSNAVEICDDGIDNNCDGIIDALYVTDFESGYEIWNDGGANCRKNRDDAAYATSGEFCVRLRNAGAEAVLTSDALDLSAYANVTIDFDYYVKSFEKVESFGLELSTDGGTNFQTVQEWIHGTDFNNDEFKVGQVIMEESFTNNTVFRFYCAASGNADWVYLDDVTITGCAAAAATNSLIANDRTNAAEETPTTLRLENQLKNTSLKAFPNPFTDNLTIQTNAQEWFVFTAFGQLVKQGVGNNGATTAVSLGELPAGVYYVKAEREVVKVVKQ